MASLLSYALTSVSDVKESLGIASSDTSKDNLIIRKINQATRAIEAYCGRRFKETTYTQEEYAATQIDELILRQRPITATQTFGLEIRDAGLNINNWETIDPQLYFTDLNSGVINLMFNALGRWNRYRVTYSAGYATIPEDLAEACATLAAYYVRYPSGQQVGVAMLQEGQRSTRFGNNNHLLSFDNILAQLGIDQIINSYANMPVMTDR